jgi:hypothetical protein
MFNSLWMYTMNRCLLVLSALILSASVLAQERISAPLPVNENLPISAMGSRQFPPQALRGRLQVVQAPEILIDGKSERLSPGARIRDSQQRLLLAAQLVGLDLVVNFVRNPFGQVHEVWVLTEAEAAQPIRLNTPNRNFTFRSEANVPKHDDGKTPFHQLPSFEQLGQQQRQP